MAVTRRDLLGRAALGASSLALARLAVPPRAASAGPVALPSPAQVRADFQRMVDFGPRLTGSEPHNRYIEWLEREFTSAGCELLPCDVYETNRWSMQRYGLDVGGARVKVASYFPRSQETPETGVTGPFVYGGTLPAPAVNAGDAGSLQAALARYPADVASWAQGVSGTLGASAQGSILLVDLPLPPPLTQGILAGGVSYYNGQGETVADLMTQDYKRLWVVPGLALPLAPFKAMGAAGVVVIVDASYEALAGQYAPFESGYEDIPGLYVDRDTGAHLREVAAGRPAARLTLTATRKKVPTPAVTAVLPGASREAIIFNTHTDGQGFVEENGGVAFVHLARHFGSLPAGRRLKRTLVFAAWPGHMTNDLPQANGWIATHQDIVERAAAALTVEHLGCTEWNDSADKGYHPTGRAELFAVWATQGKMSELVQETVTKHDLPRTAVLRPPVQFGVGGAFQAAGVPQIGAIAGPEYLLTINDSGDMEKLDAALAARQIAWLADLATRLDAVPAADLRQGDPTLGYSSGGGKEEDPSKPAQCGPGETFAVAAGAGRSLRVRYYGRRHAAHGVVVLLSAHGGDLHRVSVELRRGKRVVARARAGTVGEGPRRVVLRRAKGARFTRGGYTLVLRGPSGVLARRAVRVG